MEGVGEEGIRGGKKEEGRRKRGLGLEINVFFFFGVPVFCIFIFVLFNLFYDFLGGKIII